MNRHPPGFRRLSAAGPLVALLVACSDALGPAPHPATARLLTETVPVATIRLVGAGDIANCSTTYDSSTALLITNYLTQWPDAGVFTLGDNAMPDGTAQDYSTCYQPTWGAFRDRTRASLGNHDYNTGTAAAAFDYWGTLVGPRDLAYYSYDLGAWHVVVLNSNTGYVPASLGSPQETWLKNDLAANTKACILAYWHHPRFYSTTSGSYGLSTRMRQIWIDLYQAGATLILNGDQHQYERYAPQDPDGAPTARGIRQFIVGTGGDWSNAQPTILAPNSQVQKGSTYGVLELQLGDGWYSWNYMGIPGRTFADAGTASCVNQTTPVAPIARPGGPYSGAPGVSITFDGSASSDPDGDLPLTFAWDFGDGTTGSGATPTHAFAAAGSYTVTLVVTDTTGASSAPATTTASIGAANLAPIAAPGGPYAGREGIAVAFDGGASSDPDGNVPLTYAWQFGDGATGTGAAPTHSYAAAGSYTVTLIVTDARGLAGTPATTTATIAANQPPVANVGGPYAGSEGSAVAFDGSASSDPEDGKANLTYAWKFGDGSSGSGPTPTHAYADEGTYEVTLTVTDASGAHSAVSSTTATIVNAAPVVDLGADGTAIVGKSYTVRWSFSDAGAKDGPWSYTIDWGDGSGMKTGTAKRQGAPLSASHTYGTAGSYTITISVTDRDGGTGTSTRTVVVN